MEVKISYRQLEPQPQVEERITNKAQKLKKFFNGKMHVEWTCIKEGETHQSDVVVRGDHFEVFASAQNLNLFKSIDDVTDKLEKQILKKNELLKDKIHRK